MFKQGRFAQVATAAVGALILSTLSIGAAVGPASASAFAAAPAASVALGAQANG